MPWSPATMQVGGRGARGGGRRRWPSCKRQLVYSVLCPTHAWGGGKRAQDPRPFPSCPWLRGAAEGVKARQQAIHERLQLYWGEVEAASQRVAVEAARGRAGERGRACSCLGLSCSRGGRGACSCQQDMLPAAAPTCASCPHMRQLPCSCCAGPEEVAAAASPQLPTHMCQLPSGCCAGPEGVAAAASLRLRMHDNPSAAVAALVEEAIPAATPYLPDEAAPQQQLQQHKQQAAEQERVAWKSLRQLVERLVELDCMPEEPSRTWVCPARPSQLPGCAVHEEGTAASMCMLPLPLLMCCCMLPCATQRPGAGV